METNKGKCYCRGCKSKAKRVSKINTVKIGLIGPEYGSYTKLSSGFTLYANIENDSEDILKIRLKDFYVYSNGMQIVPQYNLEGYAFLEEYIFPKTVKCAGKIFDVGKLKDGKLEKGDYTIVTLQIDDKKHLMFKVLFDGYEWRLNDYKVY